MGFLNSRSKQNAMAGKRIDIMDLKQLITLKRQGVSNRKAAQILHLSRNTVNDYMHLLEGLNYIRRPKS